MVQGRENPAMICRCQKVGIGEKSGGHRRIYKACDVPFRNELGQLTIYKSGERYVYVEPVDPPLPVNQKVRDFTCLAFHHGKLTGCKACGIRGYRVGDNICAAKPKHDEYIVTFRGYKSPLSNHFSFVLSAYETTFASVEHAFF